MELQDLDVSDGADGFHAKAESMVTAIFGDAVDFAGGGSSASRGGPQSRERTMPH